MGQKVHPYGFRLGIIRKPRSRWFAEGAQYRQQLLDDMTIRNTVLDVHRNAGISDIHIERSTDNINVTIQTAKPGIIIGRGGADVDRLRQRLEKKLGTRLRLNVEETPDPDRNAQLIAESIASQIERRVSHRRAMQQAIDRAVRVGALGIRITVAGRLGGAEIARSESIGPVGQVPLHTLRADVEFGLAHAHTAYGPIGCKVWVYKGEILPPRKGERKYGEEEDAGPTTEDWERVAAASRRLTEEAQAAAAPTAEETIEAPPRGDVLTDAETPVELSEEAETASDADVPVADETAASAEPAVEEAAAPEPPTEEEKAQEDEQDVDA